MSGLTVDVDTRALIHALDTLGAVVEKHVREAAQITAMNIAAEARARVRRRTGKTAAGVTTGVARQGTGYVVFVNRPDQPGLPGWIEFGTKHMTAKPFLFAAARLESGSYDRRIREAIQAAIDEAGLG